MNTILGALVYTVLALAGLWCLEALQLPAWRLFIGQVLISSGALLGHHILRSHD